MSVALTQLHLPVQSGDSASFDNFWSSDANRPAVDLLRRLAAQPDGSNIYLSGPEGSGVSHLLQATAREASSRDRRVAYLEFDLIPAERGDEFLDSFDVPELLVLDGVDRIAADDTREETLFHLLNRAANARCSVVIGSSAPLALLPVGLPDLQSRLAAMLNLAVEPLADEDKRRALALRATARGFEMPEAVLDYLLTRGSRRMRDLIGYLDQLDRVSLSSRRRVTLPLVREVLGNLGMERCDDGR